LTLREAEELDAVLSSPRARKVGVEKVCAGPPPEEGTPESSRE